MPHELAKELAPTGTLRAGINLSNFLLVTGKSPSGEPEGVAPDMARAIADRLGVKLKLVPFKTPSTLTTGRRRPRSVSITGITPPTAAE